MPLAAPDHTYTEGRQGGVAAKSLQRVAYLKAGSQGRYLGDGDVCADSRAVCPTLADGPLTSHSSGVSLTPVYLHCCGFLHLFCEVCPLRGDIVLPFESWNKFCT